MQFPLELKFKILALAPQITVTDATGSEVAYVRQKLFKLKEKVNVFSDSSKGTELAFIGADRVIDFSARYRFTGAGGVSMGSMKRKGMKSLWKAHYDIFPADSEDTPDLQLREENPFAKVMDGMFGSIPILGAATGYFFHPRYLISDSAGTPLIRLEKQRSFLEAKFTMTQVGDASQDQAVRAMLSAIMMALLERSRG
ncbi:MAG: hypothetical protein AAGA58_11825 [Verrucomicrobiota bacterium]